MELYRPREKFLRNLPDRTPRSRLSFTIYQHIHRPEKLRPDRRTLQPARDEAAGNAAGLVSTSLLRILKTFQVRITIRKASVRILLRDVYRITSFFILSVLSTEFRYLENDVKENVSALKC